MGITSKKQKNIPKDQKPFNGSEFDTIPVFDNSRRDPKTGVGVPTPDSVRELRHFVEENKQ